MSGAREESRPRVLWLAPYFPPAFYGGAVQVYLGLLRHMQDFDVSVLADLRHTTADTAAAWDHEASRMLGATVRRIPAFELHLPQVTQGRGRFAGGMGAIARLWTFVRSGRREWKCALRRYRPDVVVSGQTFSAGWLTAAMPDGVPLVNYLHGEELTMQTRSRRLSRVMRQQQLRSIRNAALNIAVSEYTARLTAEMAAIAPDRVTLLPNFVDTSRFALPEKREALRAQRGWAERFIVLTLARLERRKGIDQALRALALLKQQGRMDAAWRYVIAGRGEEADALRALTRELGLMEQVEFAGFVPDSDIVPMYQAADVFLQPNREIDGDTEGFGIVFLEASACGLPVIGGTAGGTAEAIADGVSGYRVDGESVEAIAAALGRLSGDAGLRRRLGEQGAARVRAQFTEQAAAARFGSLLLEVIKAARVKQKTR